MAADPRTSRLPYIILFAWACLLLWPAVLQPGQPLVHPRYQHSDLLISHWPNAEFLRRSLFEYRQFPLWNPSILGGAPFAADPLAGVWYPPNWLAVILPLPFAFNLLLVLHLAWAGWGMYRWARADGFGLWPSLIGGLAFAGMPKMIAHIGAGHVSLVYAAAWTPWLMQIADCRFQISDWRRPPLLSLAWAMTFLADARWGAYAGVVMVVWWLVRNRIWRATGSLVLCVALFLLLTAVLWLPTLEFVQHSSRAAMTIEEAGEFSLPARYLFGLFVPDVGGYQEYMTYLGIAPLALAVIGASQSRDRVGNITMIAIVLLSLWWALGPGAGLFTLLVRLPGMTLLRAPSRALFVAGLGMCWLAVRGAAAVEESFRIKGRAWNLASAGIIAAVWLLAVGGSLAAKKPISNLFITAFAMTSVLIALRVKPALTVLILAAAVELLWVDSTFVESRPLARSPVAEWLANRPGVWRVYSPSYSLPQLDAAQLGLEQADGVNPLQLADTVTFMEAATGVKRTGYSVTLPPFEPRGDNTPLDVATANAGATPDAKLLGEMNVRFVASEFDIVSHGLELRARIGRTRIYENMFDAGRVYGGALVSWSPNRIVARAAGPGRVTLAEVWYPGWSAAVDGVPAEMERDRVFRSAAVVSEGTHEIVFEFRPVIVYVGMTLSLIGFAVTLSALRIRR